MKLSAADIDEIADAVALRLRSGGPKKRPPRPSESERHRDLVATLKTEGASVGAFHRTVEKAVGARFDLAVARIIPDAYKIDVVSRSILFYEVCVSHGIPGKKRGVLRAWRDWLTARGWSIRLVRVDVDGGRLGVDLDHGDIDDESRRRAMSIILGREP